MILLTILTLKVLCHSCTFGFHTTYIPYLRKHQPFIETKWYQKIRLLFYNEWNFARSCVPMGICLVEECRSISTRNNGVIYTSGQKVRSSWYCPRFFLDLDTVSFTPGSLWRPDVLTNAQTLLYYDFDLNLYKLCVYRLIRHIDRHTEKFKRENIK